MSIKIESNKMVTGSFSRGTNSEHRLHDRRSSKPPGKLLNMFAQIILFYKLKFKMAQMLKTCIYLRVQNDKELKDDISPKKIIQQCSSSFYFLGVKYY